MLLDLESQCFVFVCLRLESFCVSLVGLELALQVLKLQPAPPHPAGKPVFEMSLRCALGNGPECDSVISHEFLKALQGRNDFQLTEAKVGRAAVPFPESSCTYC